MQLSLKAADCTICFQAKKSEFIRSCWTALKLHYYICIHLPLNLHVCIYNGLRWLSLHSAVETVLHVCVTFHHKGKDINKHHTQSRLHPLLLPNKENRGNLNPYISMASLVTSILAYINKYECERCSHNVLQKISLTIIFSFSFFPSIRFDSITPIYSNLSNFFQSQFQYRNKIYTCLSQPLCNFRSHNKTPSNSVGASKAPLCRCTLIMLFCCQLEISISQLHRRFWKFCHT